MSEEKKLSAEEMRYLIEDVSKPQVVPIFENSAEKTVLVASGDGKSEIKSYAKDRPVEKHQFHTLEGLVDYLRDVQDIEERTVIFVGKAAVRADLAYKSTQFADEAVIALRDSPEYAAFKALTQGVDQKELWRLLSTDLYGCVDPSLLMAISTLKKMVKSKDEIRIDPTGVVSHEGGLFHEIVCGEACQPVALAWTFSLPIFECFPGHRATIETRLEIDTDGGIEFTFHPRQLERVLAEERLALVACLRERIAEQGIENVTVLEGER